MIAYSITIIVSVFLAFASEHVSIRRRHVPRWIKVALVALPSILVTGFRYRVGTDYNAYRFAYENPDFPNVVKNFEILNRLYFKLIHHWGGSFYSAVFFASAAFFIITYSQVYKKSTMPWMSTYLMFGLLYFFVYMNIMRQMIAISILLVSLSMLERKKYYSFLLCILFATGIHRASIIFVILLYSIKKDINYRFLISITPIIFLLSGLLGTLIGRLASQLSYQRYLEGSDFTIRSLINMFWQILILLVAAHNYYHYVSDEEKRHYHILLSIQLLSLWSYAAIGFVRLNEVARIQYIFQFSNIIFIPDIIGRLPRKNMKVFTIGIVLLYGLFNIFSVIYLNNEHGTLPYRTIFDAL